MLSDKMPVPPLLVGVAALLAAFASIAIAFTSHKGLPGEDFTHARAAFEDVSGLREGNDVKIHGVRVGQVAALEYEDGLPVVELQLPPEVTVHRDATATIGNRSALGQKFLALDPGTPAAGGLGTDVLPVEQTAAPQELDEVLDALDEPTRDALTRAVREAGGGLVGRGEDLQAALASSPELLDDLGIVSETLAGQEDSLVGLLANVDRLAERFEGRADELSGLVASLDDTTAAVAVDGGEPLSRTLAQAPATLDELDPALVDLTDVSVTTRQALADLGDGSRALGRATPDLRGTLVEGLQPLERVPGVAEVADPAVRRLTPTLADARPLAPRVRRALDDLRDPVEVLGPYANDVAMWFVNANRLIADGDANGHWLRFAPILGVESALSVAESPTLCRDPYPAPGGGVEQTGSYDLLGGC